MTTHSVLQFSGVEKTFLTPGGPMRALAGIDLTVASGEFVSIVGPSGCGKSTLLNLAAGLESPSSGTTSLLGLPITKPVTDVGIVFQDATLMEWRTVLDNVLLQAEIRKLDLAVYRKRATELLERLGLARFLRAYPHQLSGGMKQRVGIARALVHEPSLLLMDEPFSALDALTRDKLNVDFQAICRDRATTVLFITHSITDAVFLGDRVVVMTPSPGRIADVLRIELPKPRGLPVRETPEFAQYAGLIRTTFEREGVL